MMTRECVCAVENYKISYGHLVNRKISQFFSSIPNDFLDPISSVRSPLFQKNFIVNFWTKFTILPTVSHLWVTPPSPKNSPLLKAQNVYDWLCAGEAQRYRAGLPSSTTNGLQQTPRAYCSSASHVNVGNWPITCGSREKLSRSNIHLSGWFSQKRGLF